jgi:hypothetical protein
MPLAATRAAVAAGSYGRRHHLCSCLLNRGGLRNKQGSPRTGGLVRALEVVGYRAANVERGRPISRVLKPMKRGHAIS